MRTWQYELKEGETLRDLITDSDGSQQSNINILEQLIKCYNGISKLIPSEAEDIAEYIEEIETQIDNINGFDEEFDDLDFEIKSNKEEVNYILSEFYDYCNNLNIFVSI